MRSPRLLAAALLVVTALAGCTSGPPPPADEQPYEQRLTAARAEKDAWMRTAKESPIPEGERARFPGLDYFPIDASYHVPAALTEDRSGTPVIIQMPTSQGQPRPEQRAGRLSFSIAGATYVLAAFFDADEGMSRLFVPFGDLTNGHETYGGGRHLVLDRTPTGFYDLDFNTAYHPYCLYNPSYDCPIPPKENHLQTAIRAGERVRGAGGASSH